MFSTDVKLKTARFEFSPGQTAGVAYQIYLGQLCVFTAIERSTGRSTINFAEYIALAIAHQEGVDVFSLRYFDLQTRTSYSGLSKPCPGDFEFEEVTMERSKDRLSGVQATNWLLAQCPRYVIDDFSAFIDGTPRQLVPRPFEVQF